MASSGGLNALASDEPLGVSFESVLEKNTIDWTALADGEGMVDVILVAHETGASSGLFGVMSSLERTALADPSESVVKREYSRTFGGLAARMSVESILTLQSDHPTVQVFPDIQMSAMAGENIEQVGADLVWSLDDSGGTPVMGYGIVVAIVDTGVDYTHPDLGGGFGSGYKVIGGYDFVNDDGDPMDDYGHGTHVAGIVAASGGITGVAPESSILAYKVLDGSGSGTMSDVIAGIEAAMDPDGDGLTSDRADIISLSLGGDGEPGDPLCLAVNSAVDAGIVVVAAAGNSGPEMGTVASPGFEPSAITVGAVDGDGVLASFSSRGANSDVLMKPEVSAPGVNIVSTVPYSGASYSSSTGYMSMSGTSMATPHVSGVAALLLQLHPGWTPEQVKSAIITGSGVISEPMWHAGAGALWAPSAAETDLFLSNPILRVLVPDGTAYSFTIANEGAGSDFTLDSADFHSVWYNGSASEPYTTDASTVSPTSLTMVSGGTGTADVAVIAPDAPSPEGYYDGILQLTSSDHALRIPFGFAALSTLNVHVLGRLGTEISDPRGLAFVYSYPDASVSLLVESTPTTPCPPASFLLPSGTYSTHALGHQLFYSFSDPYILSGQVELGRSDTVDVYLSMSDAKEFNIDLTTEDGNPIYVKDFLMYCRYVGDANVSAQVVASDGSVIGNDLFSLTKSRKLYISDTDAYVGISVAGFSYSADMWDFMSRNWDHWYERSDSTSTEFLIESTADLQYLISWEFQGVDASSTLELGIDPERSSAFVTTYDILGSLGDVWGEGTHLSIGGDATPYARGSSYTSLNPFFSGMTRTTIVQGVYYEFYWPGSLSDVYVSPEYYIPDYSHRVKASDVDDVYLPDRVFLESIEGVTESVRVGAGPFYPSVRTTNDGSHFAMLHPLLRDTGGARVATPEMPWLYLFRNGAVVYSAGLMEYLGNPDPERVAPIYPGGDYKAIFPTMSLASEVSDTAKIILGFSTSSADMNSPAVTGMTMPQRFVPGESIDVGLSVEDDVAVADVDVWWRTSGSSVWLSLEVDDLGSGDFGASILTSSSDSAIDLKFNVSDTTGNYLEYTTTSASLAQIPVLFDLTVEPYDIEYVDGDASVMISGYLTDLEGAPLSPTNAVLIDLMLDGRKVGMVLDEYVQSGSHTHNGLIQFDWHFNPARLFDSSDQTIEVTADFDLGIYQPMSAVLSLHSVTTGNSAPVIRLNSPSNGSLIAAGEPIDLGIWDDGICTVGAYLDGVYVSEIVSPYDVETGAWTEGAHSLGIVATDDESVVTTAVYEFDVDAFAPVVTIIYPTDGSHVPATSSIVAEVSDTHLSEVWYSADGLPAIMLDAPYEIDVSGWSIGDHAVVVTAADEVGHLTSESVSFVIVDGSVAIAVISPSEWSVIRSGTPIVLSAVGNGTITTSWCEFGVWHVLGSDMTIQTLGWSEGTHEILVNATNDLGESDELLMAIAIDDTPPSIVLESPANNSFVDTTCEIVFQVLDANLDSITYTIWNRTEYALVGTVMIPLTSPLGDGYFEVDVSSFDRAGNLATAVFRFAMDSSPPLLFIVGMNPGSAIQPGLVFDVTATDEFLAAVEWSLDGGAPIALTEPYTINTSSFSDGWHEFTVAARDASGKTNSIAWTQYIDSEAPTVNIVSSSTVPFNESFEVVVDVSDDFGVASVTLYFEIEEGGYGTTAMIDDGTGYVAEISSEFVWDGMTIYIVAEDTVGNSVESARTTLSEESLPDEGTNESPAEAPESVPRHESWNVMLTVGSAIAVSVLILSFMAGKKRRTARRASDTFRGSRPASGVARTVVQAVADAVGPKPTPVVPSAPIQQLNVGRGRAPSNAREATGKSSATVIPTMIASLVMPHDVAPGDPSDFVEMVERELNDGVFRRSGLRQEARPIDFDAELESLIPGPEIVSGLELKRRFDIEAHKG